MPKARRALHNIQYRLIYTILLSISASTSAVAQDSDLLDCNAFSFEGVTYDLKSLASERTVTRTRDNPPSTMEDELRFNICEDLTLKDGVPADDQCPAGTRACLTETNLKEGLDARIITAIPVAQTSVLKPSFRTLHSPAGLSIELHGPSYPPKTSPVPQSFNLTLLCAQDGGSDPTFAGYANGVTRVEWNTTAGCPAKDDGDNSGGSGGGEKDADSSSGSGIGWFFLLLFISFVGYFAVGAYYNYNNFGATGWDLVPHRDFWRDVPYLLRDFTDHLCSTLRPGRQGGSRRGYMAV
ncbi:autophagy-related protein 27 [Gautieria morchelliformis]|nr:autophagy-related protein 27 [Gautieria morchelliformis]